MFELPYAGILCIGDPHLSSRVPGFRKDDYPRVVLDKFRWCLDLARRERLLPVVLGDLFHWPRDNANWLTVELMRLLEGQRVLTIAGNHDCNENQLGDDDTLSILVAAGRLTLLDRAPWIGEINGIPVAIGGTSWGRPIIEAADRAALGDPRWVFWITHHDIAAADSAQFGSTIECHEIPGVDLVVNGHIHHTRPEVVCGQTTWCTPGNIARIKRGDATRSHRPSVLRIDVTAAVWNLTQIVLPHAVFEEVFHSEIFGDTVELGESQFVQGLAALQKFKTSGDGVREFLRRNIEQFADQRVRDEIMTLAEEVLNHGV
jgi:DNA repair exonuclease SbcCD nuclease subunit